MPEQSTTPPATPTPLPAPIHEQPPGYFNQAQLDDITSAEELLAVAGSDAHKARLGAEGFGDAERTLLRTATGQARTKTTETGQAGDKKRAASLNAQGAQRDLIEMLHGIQSAAKQKKRLLDADEDAATTFSLEGYLIGTRLNPNKATLIQNAVALLAKATADALPGFDAARLGLVATAITDYKDSKDEQAGANEDAGGERIARDKIIKRINALCAAMQHAADRAYPYTVEENAPARTSFKLAVDRVFNG